MYKNLKIHFIGIGGIGMSGIAEVLLNLGYPISGSDLKQSTVTKNLENLGAQIFYKHDSENIEGADVVVYSSAVAKDNIEIDAAHRLGIPVIRRAEMLAELMRLKKFGITVAGTHGKTTTTSLLASLLQDGGLDPTLVIGGKINQLSSNAKLGKGDFMVVEADESDGSFLHLSPTLAVITNIDPDHMENFKDTDHYINAFDEFANKIPFYGLVVLCAENSETLKLTKRLDKRIQTYGFSKDHDWSAHNIKYLSFATAFDLYQKDQFMGRLQVQLMGDHNILNTLAAIAIAHEIGLKFSLMKKTLENFTGVGRRLECLYEDSHFAIFDDYAHHPTEILATLSAMKNAFPKKRLKVLFQPHRYSRLKFLFEEFTKSFDNADELFLAPLYEAGEKPIRGISSQALYEALKNHHPKVNLCKESDDLAQTLFESRKKDDIFIILGAGDITLVAKKLKKQIQSTTLDLQEEKETHVGSENG